MIGWEISALAAGGPICIIQTPIAPYVYLAATRIALAVGSAGLRKNATAAPYSSSTPIDFPQLVIEAL